MHAVVGANHAQIERDEVDVLFHRQASRGFELLDDDRADAVEGLAKLLGLRRVGFIFACPPREEGFVFSGDEAITADTKCIAMAVTLADDLAKVPAAEPSSTEVSAIVTKSLRNERRMLGSDADANTTAARRTRSMKHILPLTNHLQQLPRKLALARREREDCAILGCTGDC